MEELLLGEHDGGLCVGHQYEHVGVQAEPGEEVGGGGEGGDDGGEGGEGDDGGDDGGGDKGAGGGES